jgi:hypothetical protein
MAGPVAHNPLHAAARDTMAVAREAKSPLLERVAIFAMIGSAITGMAVAALHALHLIRKDLRDDQRERVRPHDRRPEAATAPQRPEDRGDELAATPHPARDGDERKWSRREEHAGHTQARQR